MAWPFPFSPGVGFYIQQIYLQYYEAAGCEPYVRQPSANETQAKLERPLSPKASTSSGSLCACTATINMEVAIGNCGPMAIASPQFAPLRDIHQSGCATAPPRML